jgi:Tol biopolymer transport system component
MRRTTGLSDVSIRTIILLIALAGFASGCSEPQRRADVPDPPVIGRSVDALHVAWAQYTETKKLAVSVDGWVEPRAYDEIGVIVFSPDGRRVAYTSKSGTAWRVVVDGNEGPEFDDVCSTCLRFSPDGRRLVYGAKRGDRWFIVLDGRIRPESGCDFLGSLSFSPDSSRLAYMAGKGSTQALVVEGKIGRYYDIAGEPIWSPDGKRLAYTAAKGARRFVVTDGREGPSCDGVNKPVFSPDGASLAYSATRGDKRLVVVDGREGPAYDMTSVIDPIVFFPKGDRVMYPANRDGRWFVVAGNEEGPHFTVVLPGSLTLNPDGRGFAYIAFDAGRAHVVVDGLPGHGYESIAEGGPVYSADGKHLIFAARKGKAWVIVRDGRESAEFDYDQIGQGGPVFSPDASHTAYAASKDGRWFVVVNGRPGPAFDRVGKPSLRNDGVEYLAEREGDGCLYRFRQTFISGESGKSETEAGKPVQTKLGWLPKTTPPDSCVSCQQQKELLQ